MLETSARPKRAFVFHFQGLAPNTKYVVALNGVCKYNNTRREEKYRRNVEKKKKKGRNKNCFFAICRMARFKTKEMFPTTFRMFVLSCDRPSRLLLGETRHDAKDDFVKHSIKRNRPFDFNFFSLLHLYLGQQDPWQLMLRRVGEVDAVVHIGDQIYPDNEDISRSGDIFSEIWDGLNDDKRRSMMLRGRELWRNKYRGVFSREAKADLMASVSNLMVWSDNDVANDFTAMRVSKKRQQCLLATATIIKYPVPLIQNSDGGQRYHPHFLQCGMRTYREYQRRLWDPSCPLTPPGGAAGEVREWHAHHYGAIGIFLFDLRGNRIDAGGRTEPDKPLLCDAQWADLEAFFARPELRVAVLCSETPFLGDEPAACRQKVQEDSQMDFLKDHWPYNEAEIIRLLDLCFAWKAEGERSQAGREVLLVGGDIHCGVTSVVRDEVTGQQMDQLTASPVTNHVCKFFPPLQGRVSDRYSFSHLPLGRKFRNFADVSISVGARDVSVQAKLVPVSTDIFKDDTWRVEDPEEDEEDGGGYGPSQYSF